MTRDMLVSEPDDMPVEEFITKSAIWLRMLEKEIQLRSSG